MMLIQFVFFKIEEEKESCDEAKGRNIDALDNIWMVRRSD